ncbi:MAG: divergent PAP2 family protein [Spirochaetaceae bacterium]|jgi:acid phosphatase family membrane protein YuiD|nr:divergent PAP2 family protein [Spirochaetaceae bacterium]
MGVLRYQLQSLFTNILFISALSSWFVAQVIKALIVIIQGRWRSAGDIMTTLAWRTGGMPSSHASMVSGLTTAVAIKDGISSDLFVVMLFMALVIIRDALGVRRSSGLQARTLNQMGQYLADTDDYEYQPLKEVLGHKPMEVVVGCLLGIIIASALAFL